VSGTPQVGQVLTASGGALTPDTAKKSYQWYRDTDQISGETWSTYTLTAADEGHTFKVTVIGEAPGYAMGFTTSAPTAPVTKSTSGLNTDSLLEWLTLYLPILSALIARMMADSFG
jgi:hypothetical protein